MPGTYSQILLHIVFATKHRQPWITADLSPRLYAYMGGIIRSEKGVLYGIGGIEDHVRLASASAPPPRSGGGRHSLHSC